MHLSQTIDLNFRTELFLSQKNDHFDFKEAFFSYFKDYFLFSSNFLLSIY